jgi:hypothetical protein
MADLVRASLFCMPNAVTKCEDWQVGIGNQFTCVLGHLSEHVYAYCFFLSHSFARTHTHTHAAACSVDGWVN